MIKILIIIFSATGNTAKIAEVIQQELKQLGSDIEVKDITSYDDRKDLLDLTLYHAVIFGFPIHARRAPRIVREWLDTLDGIEKSRTPLAKWYLPSLFSIIFKSIKDLMNSSMKKGTPSVFSSMKSSRSLSKSAVSNK
ncbi:flavodoxin domain-containing protein [bacterium]|nr:flavodoxin domain-containing protein [bacterium]